MIKNFKGAANFITILRVLMAFAVIALLYCKSDASYWSALILVVLVMWGDGLDGFVARKFNLTSKLGAVLDIMGDRVVENIFWVVFCALGWISIWVPLIVLTRGIVVDSLRSLAFEAGHTAFGEKTMMQNPVAKFIVASNFSRFTYAVCKAAAFVLLIAGNPSAPIPEHIRVKIFFVGIICTWISVAFCILRGLPVIFESKRFLND